MSRVIKFLLKLVLTILILAFFTAAWVIFDGINDLGEKSDAALATVSSSESSTAGEIDAILDKTAKLYRNGEYLFVVVGGGSSEAENVKYLEGKGVPEASILKLPESASTTEQVAAETAKLLKDNGLKSVMIVTEYYHVTRTKLALNHEGVTSVQKVHIGQPNKADVQPIAREIVALYDYVARVYVVPATESLFKQAKTETTKVSEEAKDKVNNSLDSMKK